MIKMQLVDNSCDLLLSGTNFNSLIKLLCHGISYVAFVSWSFVPSICRFSERFLEIWLGF